MRGNKKTGALNWLIINGPTAWRVMRDKWWYDAGRSVTGQTHAPQFTEEKNVRLSGMTHKIIMMWEEMVLLFMCFCCGSVTLEFRFIQKTPANLFLLRRRFAADFLLTHILVGKSWFNCIFLYFFLRFMISHPLFPGTILFVCSFPLSEWARRLFRRQQSL